MSHFLHQYIIVILLHLFLLNVVSCLPSHERYCPGLEIKEAEQIANYSNCTVITGHLYIGLTTIDDDSVKHFNFSLLKEIVGHLTIYRVTGSLSSLQHLFPALIIIRGDILQLKKYSFIFVENKIKRLGLHTLREISNGGVWIESNSELCHDRNTVEWSAIMRDAKAPIRIHSNRIICPSPCPKTCSHCWSPDLCQAVCSSSCRKANLMCHMNDSNKCCHRECAGGCYDNGPEHCLACRKINYNGTCTGQCPVGLFEYKSSSCLQRSECISLTSVCEDSSGSEWNRLYPTCQYNHSVNGSTRLYRQHAILSQRCVPVCPENYNVDQFGNCKPCSPSNVCLPRNCGNITISDSHNVDNIRGCYSVQHLKIDLSDRNKNLSDRLIEVFSSLRVINGSLSITNSKPLGSLEFLRPLEKIQGNLWNMSTNQSSSVEHSQIVLEISANENLRELWKPASKLIIENGRISIRINRRLCPDKVLYFIENHMAMPLTHALTSKEIRLIKTSNGDLTICKLRPLNVSIDEIHSKKVTVNVEPGPELKHSAFYSLVVYRPVTDGVKNLKHRVGCGDSEWLVSETACLDTETRGQSRSVADSDDVSTQCHLKSLQPATKYALYVEIRTAYAGNGGISDIIYFETAWDVPSSPRDLMAQSLSPTEILLRWQPPEFPNGHLEKYILTVSRIALRQSEFGNRDFCNSNNQLSISINFHSIPFVDQRIQDSIVKELIQGKHCTCEDCNKHCSSASHDSNWFSVYSSSQEAMQHDLSVLAEEDVLLNDRIDEELFHSRFNPIHFTSLTMTMNDNEETMIDNIKWKEQQMNNNNNHNQSSPFSLLNNHQHIPAAAGQTNAAGIGTGGGVGGGGSQSINSISPPSITPPLKPSLDNEIPFLTVDLPINRTHFIFNQLKHFSEYSFKVIVCQSETLHPSNNQQDLSKSTNRCSQEAVLTHWTASSPLVDDIPWTMWSDSLEKSPQLQEGNNSIFKHFSHLKHTLLWKRPKRPNGVVLHFWLRYRQIHSRHGDIPEDSLWTFNCVSLKDWFQTVGLSILSPSSSSSSTSSSSSSFEMNSNNNNTFPNDDVTTSNEMFSEDGVPYYGGYHFANAAPGEYAYQVMAVTIAGNATWSQIARFTIEQADSDSSHLYIPLFSALGGCVLIFIPLFIAVFVYFMRQNQREPEPQYFLFEGTFSREWLIDRDKLRIYDNLPALGKGSFGMVYRGQLDDFNTPQAKFWPQRPLMVAVKTLAPGCSYNDVNEFLNEARNMLQLSAPHVVQFLGLVAPKEYKDCDKPQEEIQSLSVNNKETTTYPEGSLSALHIFDDTDGKPSQETKTLSNHSGLIHQPLSTWQPMVVMELLELGDLASYLRREGDRGFEGHVPPHTALLWAAQVADGMNYIIDKGFVHRDLAARNCLLSTNKTLKIADFGLTRFMTDGYYYKQGRGKLPIRWMAPEALKWARFTPKSDVWSYGIVLWEISTLASLPYFGMNNEEVRKYVEERGNLGSLGWPNKCPPLMIEIMSKCWEYDVDKRLTFQEILTMLEPHVDDNFRKQSYFHTQIFNKPERNMEEIESDSISLNVDC